MMEVLLAILTGSGATVAVINVYGKIRLKRMDTSVGERQQFIKEVGELRGNMNELYKQHYTLMRENSDLKLKIQDLEDHIKKKSKLIRGLKSVLDSYSPDTPEIFVERVKNLVSHYELSGG